MTDAELDRLFAFLEIPSVSARPEHAADMDRAAAFCAEEIRAAGGGAEVLPTAGHPLVLGEVPPSSGGAAAPRVLIYGHYDVQPAGDPALWTTPAFAPVVRGDHLYARGASDDKGNLFMLLSAVRRLARAGRLPVRAAFLIDGEEETGGSSAVDHLASDGTPATCCLIYDGHMIEPGLPAFDVGVRGMLYRRLRVRTAAADAHSGLFGGAALNAAHALAAILGAVLPSGGRVPEPLRQGAAPLAPAEVEALGALPSGAEALAEGGVRPADPEAADEFYLRTTAQPSLDVHGLACGEPDAVKTNIPSTAAATLSLRLAPGQSTAEVAPVLDALLRSGVPPGAELEIEHLAEAEPALVNPDDPFVRAAAAAMGKVVGRPPAMVRTGGTLPIVAALARRGIPIVLTGLGLPEDNIHAPDERLRVEHLELGTRAAMAILEAIAGAREVG